MIDKINEVLADGGEYAPDEVPDEFADWVRSEIARRHEGGSDDGNANEAAGV
jgi:hypothetical protein